MNKLQLVYVNIKILATWILCFFWKLAINKSKLLLNEADKRIYFIKKSMYINLIRKTFQFFQFKVLYDLNTAKQ